MSKFAVNKVDTFPEISRSGRVSEELKAIIDALNESVNTGGKFCIDNVLPGKPYNSMQQRIRAQAKKLNYKIIIRFDAESNKLYFKASRMGLDKTSVNTDDSAKAKEVSGVSTKAKTSNK